MRYDVWITVRGEQYYEDADPGETELTTIGTMENTADGWTISYDETELTGLAGTHTTFIVGAERTVLRRSGTLNSEMIFETGKMHTSLYELPFGTLTVDIHTDSIRQKLSERGGLLEIRYKIAVEHQIGSQNCFKVHVRRRG